LASKKKKTKYRYVKRFKKRARKAAKVPFEILVAGAAIPFTSPHPGYKNPVQALQDGQPEQAIDALKMGFLGMDSEGNIDIFGAINPFNTEKARYSKMLMGAGIIYKVRRKITGKGVQTLMRKIPLVGRWVQ